MMDHEKYIKHCFKLAMKAKGQTSPNPLVGSIIVKDNIIIAEGFHQKAGLDHAEKDALKRAPSDLSAATLYCNLEPCCHTDKKTPPCTDSIISSRIKRVVIANLDPNPQVAGKGIKALQAAGIEVIQGILEQEGRELNEVFFHHILNKTPFIHIKWAQTLDGKTATTTFDSKWITNSTARNYAHKERDLYDAIMVGANTLNRDDPKLTIRLDQQESSKVRIIVSKTLTLNPSSHVFTDQFKHKTYIVSSTPGIENYQGVKVIFCPLNDKGQFELDSMLRSLYSLGICSLYIEGGMELIGSFLQEKKYNRVSVYIAPKILGNGASLKGSDFAQMKDSLNFEHAHYTQFENNILFESTRNLCLQD